MTVYRSPYLMTLSSTHQFSSSIDNMSLWKISPQKPWLKFTRLSRSQRLMGNAASWSWKFSAKQHEQALSRSSRRVNGPHSAHLFRSQQIARWAISSSGFISVFWPKVKLLVSLVLRLCRYLSAGSGDADKGGSFLMQSKQKISPSSSVITADVRLFSSSSSIWVFSSSDKLDVTFLIFTAGKHFSSYELNSLNIWSNPHNQNLSSIPERFRRVIVGSNFNPTQT